MEQPVTKSRDLSLIDFYSVLQQEFISYYVRSKIYPKPFSEKYKNYCICKRDKIEKISEKNNLPSIFNSNSTKERCIREFFAEYGLPNFEYRDEKSKSIMGRWDSIYFFREGVKVRIKLDSEYLDLPVIKNMFSDNSVTVKVKGELEQFNYSYVSRILTDSLVDWDI